MSTEPAAQTVDPDALAPKLGPAQVGMRADVEVHRHVFRGEPSYVIRDPVTLAVHRVSPEDYQIVAALTNERPLAEVFADLVAQGVVEQDDEEPFYRFILSLHSLGFLSLPVPDDKSLYERRLKKQKAKRNAKLMGFLFMQVPVWNPDAFLSKTGHLVTWAFTRWAMMIWLFVVATASVLLWQSRGEFFQPLTTIFTPTRLIGLWFTLVGMKVLHEFGHAYACRLRGGEVPEMGVYLIAGTPCAYVDATSSWGFTRRFDRLAVILAGVYVELFVAALAVFVWVISPSAAVKVIMFDVVLVAGIATIIANLNPLMRFDGYYLCSDLLEIPNLRSNAQRYCASLVRWVALGTKPVDLPYGPGIKVFLAVFGVASALYKFTIVMGISALLATKALWLGIGLAVFYAGGEVLKVLRSTARYLIHSEDAAERRIRASVLALIAFGVLPGLLVLMPVPRQVKATASIGREVEAAQYPLLGGFLESVDVVPGDRVTPGEPLATVRNNEAVSMLADAVSVVDRARIRAIAALSGDRAEGLRHEYEARAGEARVQHLGQQFEAAVLQSPVSGTVIDAVSSNDIGRFLKPDTPVATVVDGRWVVRAMMRAEGFAALGLAEGDEIAFRSENDPSRTYPARVIRIKPAGSKDLANTEYTVDAGGDVAISPVTGQADQAYFLVEAAISDPEGLVHGMTGRVRLGHASEPLATTAWRAALRLLQRLEMG
ncbi:MAG: HlyD family efflux transporter periplasmic adaptor subunit [Planctomycetota bacterium]